MAVRIPEIALNDSSPFPFKSGTGSSTEFDLVCGLCGQVYNEGTDKRNEPGEEVKFIEFGHIIVAQCCFEDIEGAVLGWAPDIVAWLDWRARKHAQAASELQELAQKGWDVIVEGGDF